MKSGDMESALVAFDSMGSNVDSISWNIMVLGYLDHGLLLDGLRWFTQAGVAGFEPNASTLILLLQACRSLGAYREGLKIHGYIIRSGFDSIDSVQNSLLSLYADSDMWSAQKLFDEMPERDVISWSVMISGYAWSEGPGIGLELFKDMLSDDGIRVDGVTVASVLKACSKGEDVHMGKQVHGIVIRRGFNDDLFIGNSLTDMYSKCKDVDSALKVFREMPRKNNVSWNSIISGFVLHQKFPEALSLFNLMLREGVQPDEVSLVNLLHICKFFLSGLHCKSVHSVMLRKGYALNELLVNSLIDAYAKCSLVDLAWKVFDGIKRKSVVLWSTMIAGLTHCDKPYDAITIFLDMPKAGEKPTGITIINLLEACSVLAALRTSKWAHGIAIRQGLASDVAVGTAIVHMYSKCGAIDASRKAFDWIPQKNLVSRSAMLAAYGINGLPKDALAMLTEMKSEGLKPNAVTALSILSACNHGGLIEEGLVFFKSMVQDHGIEPGLEHYSCLVDMLGRAGMVDVATDLVKNLPDTLKAGASAWGAILSACRSYGNREIGVGALSQVVEMEPFNSSGYLLASGLYAAESSWDNAARMRMQVDERCLGSSGGYSLVHFGNEVCRFVAGDWSNPRAAEIRSMVEQLHSCMGIDE